MFYICTLNTTYLYLPTADSQIRCIINSYIENRTVMFLNPTDPLYMVLQLVTSLQFKH